MLSTISLNPSSSSFPHSSISLGLGRAPRIRSRFHTAKPYARSVSTQRAKKSTKTEIAIQPIKGKSRARSVFSESSTRENVKVERKERELIQGMKSMEVESRGNTIPPKPDGFRFDYIPLKDLPMEVIPPVPDIRANGQTISAAFIFAKLSHMFPEYLIIANMHKPYIQFSVPSPRGIATPAKEGVNIRHLDEHFSELAMGVPAVVESSRKGIDHPWVRKMYGRSPDAILNVREIGKEGSKGAMYPVNMVVYMSQCALWHQRIERGRAIRWSTSQHHQETYQKKAGSVSGESDITVTAEGDGKPSIKIEPPTPPTDIHLDSFATRPSASDDGSYPSDSDLSTTSTLLDPLPGSSLSLLHLPLLPLYIPHIATFNSLHLYLHQPNTNPLPHILQIDPSYCLNTETLDPYLHTLPVTRLKEMMRRVEGFWLNCRAMGVGDERIRGWVGYGWGILRFVVKKRSKRVDTAGEGFEWEDYWRKS